MPLMKSGRLLRLLTNSKTCSGEVSSMLTAARYFGRPPLGVSGVGQGARLLAWDASGRGVCVSSIWAGRLQTSFHLRRLWYAPEPPQRSEMPQQTNLIAFDVYCP